MSAPFPTRAVTILTENTKQIYSGVCSAEHTWILSKLDRDYGRFLYYKGYENESSRCLCKVKPEWLRGKLFSFAVMLIALERQEICIFTTHISDRNCRQKHKQKKKDKKMLLKKRKKEKRYKLGFFQF